MESQRVLLEAALADFVEQHTGVRPCIKPSKRAHCATSAFLRKDAARTAALLAAHKETCTLFGMPVLDAVRAENGWVLFFFRAAALDAMAMRLPPASEPDDTFFARRLWIWAQHADAQTPDDPTLLQGVFGVLFGAPDAQNTLLSAPYRLDGQARAAFEQRLGRAAKILLWERRTEQ